MNTLLTGCQEAGSPSLEETVYCIGSQQVQSARVVSCCHFDSSWGWLDFKHEGYSLLICHYLEPPLDKEYLPLLNCFKDCCSFFLNSRLIFLHCRHGSRRERDMPTKLWPCSHYWSGGTIHFHYKREGFIQGSNWTLEYVIFKEVEALNCFDCNRECLVAQKSLASAIVVWVPLIVVGENAECLAERGGIW